jgi:predicted ribosomally synthesized peptide with nif11-like leader
MAESDPKPVQSEAGAVSRELRAFRFRLRHDQLLRQRLRHAKQEATVALARELGFAISVDDLQRKTRRKDSEPS